MDRAFQIDWDCASFWWSKQTTKHKNKPDLKSPIDLEASSQEHSPPSRECTEWPGDKTHAHQMKKVNKETVYRLITVPKFTESTHIVRICRLKSRVILRTTTWRFNISFVGQKQMASLSVLRQRFFKKKSVPVPLNMQLCRSVKFLLT